MVVHVDIHHSIAEKVDNYPHVSNISVHHYNSPNGMKVKLKIKKFTIKLKLQLMFNYTKIR